MLEAKVVTITGGSSGIGQGTVHVFAREWESYLFNRATLWALVAELIVGWCLPVGFHAYHLPPSRSPPSSA